MLRMSVCCALLLACGPSVVIVKTSSQCAPELSAALEVDGHPLSTGLRSCTHTSRETHADFGAYIQTERVRAHGLEQLWRFEAQPPGHGDVHVRVDIGERLLGTGEQGLLLAGADGAAFYGHGTWVDARGERTRVPASWRDGRVELRLPRTLLNDARYPAVLDPVVSELLPVDEPVFRRGEASLRFSLAGNGEDVWIRDSAQQFWRYHPGRSSEPLVSTVNFGGCMTPRRCLRNDRVFDPYDPSYSGVRASSVPVYPIRGGAISLQTTRTGWTAHTYDAELNPTGPEREVLSGINPDSPYNAACGADACVFGNSENAVEVTIDAFRAGGIGFTHGRGAEGYWGLSFAYYAWADRDFTGMLIELSSRIMPVWDESGHAIIVTDSGERRVILPDLREVPVGDGEINDALYIESRDELWLAFGLRDLEVRRVDIATGATLESDFFYDDSDSHVVSGATKTGEAVLVWFSALADGSSRVTAGFLNAEGAVETRVELATSDSTAVPNELFVAPTETGRWLASWGDSSIVFDRAGTTTVDPALRGANALSVTTQDGATFWEVFANEGSLAVRSFNETGAPLSASAPLPLSSEGSADVASGASGFLVAASVAGVRGRDISVVRLNTAGELQDAVPLPVSAGDLDQTAPVIVDDGRGWMVFWHDARGGIYGARVAYDGTRPALNGTLLCADASNEYDAMFDGSDVWIVYAVEDELFARRFRETVASGEVISLSSGVPLGALSMGRAGQNVSVAVGLNLSAPGRFHTHSLLIDNDADGSLCESDADCTSGFCTEGGLCCDARCGSPCQTCRAARGATDDGVCGLVSADSECRASTGACDPAEFCDGVVATCPAELPPPMSCLDAGAADAGVSDAGIADAGVADTGESDGGGMDGGQTDASTLDSGTGGADDGGCSVTHDGAPPQRLALVVFAFFLLRRRRR